MSYSITLRETGESVTVRSQPDFKRQVDANRKVRELIGSKASGVLMVQVMTSDNELICIDTKALIVRYYHSKDKERQAMFEEWERLLHSKRYDEAEAQLWLTVTKPSLVDSGAVNEAGSLKNYSAYDNRTHRGTPLSAEEVDSGDLMYPF